MCEAKSTCCAVSSEKSTTYVPVIGDVICEGPGVIYVSIDPDVWRIRCQQCQQKTEHKCPLKKLKRKFKKERKVSDSDDDLRVIGKSLKSDDETDDEDESEDRDSETVDTMNQECTCSDRPGNKKPKPKVCWCSVYVPVNFLLEVEVTGEQKSEVKKKKQRNEKRNSIVQPVID